MAQRVRSWRGYTEQAVAHHAGIDRGFPFTKEPFAAADCARHMREALGR